MGAAVRYRAGAVRTLLGKAGAQTQTPHGLGASACASGPALVAFPDHRSSGGWSFCLAAVAVGLGVTATPHCLRHPPATGRAPVSACTSAQEGCYGSATAGRNPTALQLVLSDRRTKWQQLLVEDWYG